MISYIYKSSNIRNYYFIKYSGKKTRATNVKLFPFCVCGKANTPGHAVDVCKVTFLKQRGNSSKRILDDAIRSIDKKLLPSLHDYIIYVYLVLEHRKEEKFSKAIKAVKNLVLA